METYVIGIDFGTLSARALVVNCANGAVMGSSEFTYTHGVITGKLPNGTVLKPDSALQDPADYLKALVNTVRGAVSEAGIAPQSVVGIGIDATTCTILPVTEDGTPLAFLPEYAGRPHAYAKLWKHHAAVPEAEKMNALAEERKEPFLSAFGGKLSAEGMFPKLMEILHEDPEVYEAADSFLELGDFLTAHLTGRFVRSRCIASFKSHWMEGTGYPSPDFLAALHPALRTAAEDKLRFPVKYCGEKIGSLTAEAAKELGLTTDCAVGVSIGDAHAAVPACGISGDGDLLLIIGTSSCSMVCGKEEHRVPGICGVVKGAYYPDLYAYEAGQTGVGDSFAWFVKNAVPKEYAAEAGERGTSIHSLLTEKAAAIAPGESRLIALDWWNGNRSILNDSSLSGVFFGLSLETRPEEMYRALLEGTAFGARRIMEHYGANGVPVRSVSACGGISEKNPLMMQIYADVFGRPVTVYTGGNACALGAAMLGAVAAGGKAGGYDTLKEASSHMADRSIIVYEPHPDDSERYNVLYRIYSRLYDLLGVENRELFTNIRQFRQ